MHERPYECNNILTNNIRRRKARKGTERQDIRVKHKCSSNAYHPKPRYWYRRSEGIATPRLSQKHPIIQECNLFFDEYHAIKHDSTIKRKENNIPIWICNRCTFNNIQRGSYCKMCCIQYSKSNTLYNPLLNTNIYKENVQAVSLMEYMTQTDVNTLNTDLHLQNVIGLSLNKKTNTKTRKNRRRTRKKKVHKLKTDESYYNHRTQITERNKNEIESVDIKEEENIVNQEQQIIVNMTLKPLSKYNFIKAQIAMNDKETCSVNNPMKLKNFELLECRITVNDESVTMKPNDEDNKHIYLPIYLCEYQWIDLSKNKLNTKLFEVCTHCIKQCIPNICTCTRNIHFEYDSMHDPIYHLLPISYDIIRILIEYIPSHDIVANILIQFIGYKEISVLCMNVTGFSFKGKRLEFIDNTLIDIDYYKYQEIYKPMDEDDDVSMDEDESSESSMCTGGLFGNDDSSDDSSSDDEYYSYGWYRRNISWPPYSNQCKMLKFDAYCKPERIAELTKSPLKYNRIRCPNRYLQRKWSAYYKLNT